MEYPTIEAPSSRGRSSRVFLEKHGYVSRVPPIRSSDAGLVTKAPFTYYLARRLGLTKANSYSKALARGSWMHAIFEVHYLAGSDSDRRRIFADRINERISELQAVARELGISPSVMEEIEAGVEEDAWAAYSWFQAALDWNATTSRTLSKGLRHYLASFREIGSEMVEAITIDAYPKTPLVAQFDKLLYSEAQDAVYIADLKSTAGSPIGYAQAIRIDFQTRHYLYIASRLMLDDRWRKQHGIPSTATLGGMIHIVIRKPTIVYGSKDREYHYYSEGKRLGYEGTASRWPDGTWRLSVTSLTEKIGFTQICKTEDEAVSNLHEHTGKKPEKMFEGEPSPHMYEKRCREWYAEQDEADPVINISKTQPEIVLDADGFSEYSATLHRIYEAATCEATPDNFIRTRDGVIRQGNRLTDYAPFYLTPVEQWPEVIAREGFVQRWRDDDFAENHSTDATED